MKPLCVPLLHQTQYTWTGKGHRKQGLMKKEIKNKVFKKTGLNDLGRWTKEHKINKHMVAILLHRRGLFSVAALFSLGHSDLAKKQQGLV